MTLPQNTENAPHEPVRHIVFDLDGTLVDSVVICADIGRAMLLARGADVRQVSTDAVRRNISVGGTVLVADMLGDWADDPERDLIEFRERYAQMTSPASSVFDGVRETLSVLHERYESLSICSNKPQGLCEKVLGDVGLADMFKTVVGSREGIRKKPDPALLDLALREVVGARRDCLYVGDSEVDWELSRNAGVRFIGVSYGYGRFDALGGEVLVVDKFRELLAIDLDRCLVPGVSVAT
jgi:phosphoglycolate phosphatase